MKRLFQRRFGTLAANVGLSAPAIGLQRNMIETRVP
jgi:hypothetical protein